MSHFVNEKDCCRCGKHFAILGTAEDYVYKRVEPKRRSCYQYYCSWKCYREAEKEHERKCGKNSL